MPIPQRLTWAEYTFLNTTHVLALGVGGDEGEVPMAIAIGLARFLFSRPAEHVIRNMRSMGLVTIRGDCITPVGTGRWPEETLRGDLPPKLPPNATLNMIKHYYGGVRDLRAEHVRYSPLDLAERAREAKRVKSTIERRRAQAAELSTYRKKSKMQERGSDPPNAPALGATARTRRKATTLANHQFVEVVYGNGKPKPIPYLVSRAVIKDAGYSNPQNVQAKWKLRGHLVSGPTNGPGKQHAWGISTQAMTEIQTGQIEPSLTRERAKALITLHRLPA